MRTTNSPDTSIIEEPVTIDYAAMAQASVDAVKQIGEYNQGIFPGLVDQSILGSINFQNQLNPQLRENFFTALKWALPSGMSIEDLKTSVIGTSLEGMKFTQSLAEQYATGNIPADAVVSMNKAMAESGVQAGRFGNIQTNNLAKSFGFLSMNMQDKAASLYGNLSTLAGDLLGKVKALAPPTIDTGTTAFNMLNMLSTGSMGSANTAQSGVIQAAQTNADLAWASKLSTFNAGMDQYMFDKQLKAQKEAQMYQLIGSLAGAGAGVGTSAMTAFAFSDRRLKRDILQIGVHSSGLPWYSFKYLWSNEPREGFMADEVKLVNPSAVITVGGYDMVNYAIL
jgi:hypothetical protein